VKLVEMKKGAYQSFLKGFRCPKEVSKGSFSRFRKGEFSVGKDVK